MCTTMFEIHKQQAKINVRQIFVNARENNDFCFNNSSSEQC